MKRQFLLLVEWSFDHSNVEIVTFTMEGDSDEEYNTDSPLYIGRPLTRETFRDYFLKHFAAMFGTIERVCRAVDGNPMAACAKPVALYEIDGGGYGSHHFKKTDKSQRAIILEATPQDLCSFDSKGQIIF